MVGWKTAVSRGKVWRASANTSTRCGSVPSHSSAISRGSSNNDGRQQPTFPPSGGMPPDAPSAGAAQELRGPSKPPSGGGSPPARRRNGPRVQTHPATQGSRRSSRPPPWHACHSGSPLVRTSTRRRQRDSASGTSTFMSRNRTLKRRNNTTLACKRMACGGFFLPRTFHRSSGAVGSAVMAREPPRPARVKVRFRMTWRPSAIRAAGSRGFFFSRAFFRIMSSRGSGSGGREGPHRRGGTRLAGGRRSQRPSARTSCSSGRASSPFLFVFFFFFSARLFPQPVIAGVGVGREGPHRRGGTRLAGGGRSQRPSARTSCSSGAASSPLLSPARGSSSKEDANARWAATARSAAHRATQAA